MSWLTAWVMLFYCTFCITVRALDSENHKCGAIHGHRMRRSGHELFPHRPPSGNKYGHALQFENGQSIQYLKLRNPSGKFSVAFWMKPEGGQHNPAVILRAHEKCAPENSSRGWAIGLREADVTSDLRITFTVHSASSDSNTSIRSHSKIEPGRWYHVVATYDEFKMKLYVNQAKVAVGYGQKGTIFDSTTTNVCDVLEVGGDVKRGLYYRGEIDKLRLWNVAISHPKVTQSLPENSIDSDPSQVVMYDDFNDSILKNNNWIPVTDQYPRFVRSTVPEDKHDLSIRKPPCGKTICDNPEVIRSYLAHPDSRGSKHLRIRFINVMDDDGGRPMLTESEINSQFNLMQSAFSVYNISWEKKVESVRNSWLRNKIVLHDIECKVAMIGDNRHDQSCCLEITGWDGGDCKRTECPPQKTRNGVCDPECNTARNQYDGGECCKSPLSTTCIDPKSPNRRYFSIDEYKKAVGITNRDYLNVYIVNWTDENLQGTSVFPWEKTIHTELGGVVLPPKNFGTTKVLIHEIGHVLGLWHVHHGSTTEMLCSDACFESFPSLELGDLCSDTNPTIKHTTCGDPVVTTQDSCGLTQHTNTPYSNYMGYANDSCLNHFTPEQVARMHCYIDLDYQSWQTNAKPSFVPLSPRIIEAKTGSIKLSWLPPLGPGENSAINLCNECDHEHMLEQYATTAYSPVKNWPDGSKAAHEATGMPDADHCNASPYSWRPPEDTHLICPECPLYLEVGFKQAVVPNGITIWVPYSNMLLEGSEMIDAFKDILLVYIDGSTESIGNGTAQCDSPFTKPLYVSKKVSSVRIYISHVAVSVDAVKLTSVIGHPNCSECKPLRYVIHRDPPFNSGQEIRVQTARFEDTDIDITGRYEYKVRAETYDNVAGPFSPPLIYEAKHGFCGDGVIDEGENCDDGNVRDGDGCNIQCQMEDVFRCDGRPSLCYRHDGDGVCEEFEKRTSIKDCGFYTPEGFKDQWVNSVVANPQHIYLCPPEVIIGPPRSDLKCEFGDHALDAHMKCDNGWTPSNEDESTKNLWLKAYFKTPTIASALVVYFASIVPDLFEPEPVPFIKFELHGGRPTQKTTLEYRVTKVCNENPITIPIHHDMTKPFFRTQYVKILFHEDLKIAAVALRSPKYFDPVGLQHCTGSQLFHPGTQKCRTYDCSMPTCAKLMLKHSTLTKGKCKKGSLEGSTCMAQCDQGFTPVSPFEIMCSGGEWLVDGETPRCTPVKCGKPKIANAQIHCPDGTTFGKKCVYKCEEGTKPAGAGTELSVTCEADGTWSATTTFCRKTCLPPPTPLDSKLLPISKDCMKGKPFNLGDSCKYRCKQGYRPSGKHNRELNRKGHFIQRCLKDGTWSSKRCVQITCPVRNRKIFEWYNCTLGNMMGSVCRLTCPGEKVHEIRCGSDGRWDKKFQFCATVGTCDVPTTVNNVLKFDNCGTKSRPGDKCGVRCAEPGSKAVVQGDRPEELTSIMCSPFLQWYPNLNEVICIALCDNDTIGDGNCDAINNNIACRFDGGDCCDPIACGEDCDCKDIMSRYYGSGDYYPSS